MNDNILIISGTHRKESKSLLIAKHYKYLLDNKGVNVSLITLEDLPNTLLNSDVFANKPENYVLNFEQKIKQAQKIIFVVPEYNGGYPGVLKLFIDTIAPSAFQDKKAALVGVSSGHAGAQRGMDALTNVLNYLHMNVLYSKPKLSSIESLIDETGQLTDERAVSLIDNQIDLLLAF